MKFQEVANIFEQIEQTSSRNEVTQILADFYKKLTKEEGEILSYMVLGRVAPFFLNSEFNYSEKSLLSLLENYSKMKDLDIDIKAERDSLGDIGNTVKLFSEKAKFNSSGKEIKEIYDTLWGIVNIQGSGAVDRKTVLY